MLSVPMALALPLTALLLPAPMHEDGMSTHLPGTSQARRDCMARPTRVRDATESADVPKIGESSASITEPHLLRVTTSACRGATATQSLECDVTGSDATMHALDLLSWRVKPCSLVVSFCFPKLVPSA